MADPGGGAGPARRPGPPPGCGPLGAGPCGEALDPPADPEPAAATDVNLPRPATALPAAIGAVTAPTASAEPATAIPAALTVNCPAFRVGFPDISPAARFGVTQRRIGIRIPVIR